MDVWRGGIDAKLNPQRSPEAEFFQKFLFGQDFCGACGEEGELLFGRHEEMRNEEEERRENDPTSACAKSGLGFAAGCNGACCFQGVGKNRR